MKCLLIDDDQDDQEFFKIALEEISVPVEITVTGEAAEILKLLKEGVYAPDYIFLDLRIPNLDGKTCLKQIREIETLRSSKIIIFTGSASIYNIQETRSLGADHYITKPSDINSLTSSLVAVFQHPDLPFLITPER